MNETQAQISKHYGEIRVFISSTFTDMEDERNYLIKHIFPDVKRECRKRNMLFTPLDLRWGITEEESKSGRVVEICFNEIARSQPFFIGLIGGRYGWVPEADNSCFSNESFLDRYPWVRDYVKNGMSITEMEMQYAVLSNPNKVHACFFVKSEDGIKPELRETDEKKEQKRQLLKDKVRAAAREGKCRMSEYYDLPSLGRVVHDNLMALIDEVAPENKTGTVYDRYILEQQHTIESLRKCYYKISESLYEDESQYLNNRLIEEIALKKVAVVYGEPGSGVSAFLANSLPLPVLNYLDNQGKNHKVRVIHTIINDDISSVDCLKRLFLTALAYSCGNFSLPELSADRQNEDLPFAEIFSRFPQQETIWVIDGLEKLPPEVRNLSELRHLNIPGLKFVIGTSDRHSAEMIVRENNTPTSGDAGLNDIISIEPLTALAIRKITSLYLRANGKSLVERQLSFLTGCSIIETPRQLVSLLDLMIRFGNYEKLDAYIGSFTTVQDRCEFYELVLEIMENDFGTEVFRAVIGRLLYSRYGWIEDDLLDDITANEIEKAAILEALTPYCRSSAGLLSLTEADLRDAAHSRYSFSENEIADIRRKIISCAGGHIHAGKRNAHNQAGFLRFRFRMDLFLAGDADIYLTQTFITEILYQLIRLEDVRAVKKFFKRSGPLLLNDRNLAFEALNMLHRSGVDILRLLNKYETKVDFRQNEGTISIIIFIAALSLTGDVKRIRRRIKSLSLPGHSKQMLYGLLPSEEQTVSFDELWQPEEADRLNLSQYKQLGTAWNEIIRADNREWIDCLEKKVNRSIECINNSDTGDETALSFGKFVMYRLLALIAVWKRDAKMLDQAVESLSALAFDGIIDSLNYEIFMFRMLAALISKNSYKLRETANNLLRLRDEQRVADGLCAGERTDFFDLAAPVILAKLVSDESESSAEDIVEEAIESGIGSSGYYKLCHVAEVLYHLGVYDRTLPVYKALGAREELSVDDRLRYIYLTNNCLRGMMHHKAALAYLQSNRHIADLSGNALDICRMLSETGEAGIRACDYHATLRAADELSRVAENCGNRRYVAPGLMLRCVALTRLGDGCDSDKERKNLYISGLQSIKSAFSEFPDDEGLWQTLADTVVTLEHHGVHDAELLAMVRKSGEDFYKTGNNGNVGFVLTLLNIYDLADDAVAFAEAVGDGNFFSYYKDKLRFCELLYRGSQDGVKHSAALYVLGSLVVDKLNDVKISYEEYLATKEKDLTAKIMAPVDSFHKTAQNVFETVKTLGDEACELFCKLLFNDIKYNDEQLAADEKSLNTAMVVSAAYACFNDDDYKIFRGVGNCRLLTSMYRGYGLSRLTAASSVVYKHPYNTEEFRTAADNILELLGRDDKDRTLEILIKEACNDFDANFPRLFEYVCENKGFDAPLFANIFRDVVETGNSSQEMQSRAGSFCRYLLSLPPEYEQFFKAQAECLRNFFNDIYFSSADEPFTYELWSACETLLLKIGTPMPGSLLIAALSNLDNDVARNIYSKYCDGTEDTNVCWNYTLRLLYDSNYDEALAVASRIRYDEKEIDDMDDSLSLPDDNRFMRSLVYRAMGQYEKSRQVRQEPLPLYEDGNGDMVPDFRTNCPFDCYDAVTAILVDDFETADREVDLLMTYNDLYEIFRCVMMLRVNNPVAEAPVFENVEDLFVNQFDETLENFDLDDFNYIGIAPSVIILGASWRWLELARYKRRQGMKYREYKADLEKARMLYDKVMSFTDINTEVQYSGADFYFLGNELEAEESEG